MTVETGKKKAREALNSLCVFPSQMSQLFCLCGGKTVFVAWHDVFCVLFEGEDCHNKKGISAFKRLGQDRGHGSKLFSLVFTLETHTQTALS